MSTLDRRTFLRGAALVGGASASALALAACGTPAPRPTVTTTVTPTGGPTPTATGAASGPRTWSELASAVSGTLLRPTSGGYEAASLTENPRFDAARPLAVLQVADAADVTAGLFFARASKTPIAVRSGGHNYAGWSAGGAPGTGVPESLVLSTKGLADVELSDDGETLTVGPGAPLALVYEKLGAAGRAIGAGSCGTVAIGGLTLGGGVGVLVRSFGLTCDQLTGVEIVTADGVVHHASRTVDPDLFWACQGGGGGSVGIVTSLTFATAEAPGVTMFALTFPWAAASDVVAAWQDWAPGADEALWSTCKLLGGSRHPTPIVSVSGTWTGEEGGYDAAVAPFLRALAASPSKAEPLTSSAVRRGYADAMLRYAGCAGEPAARCTTSSGGVPSRVSESATSSIGSAALSAAGITALVARVSAAADVVGMTEGGVSLDALGGRVGAVGASDTAFPYRDALMTVQYTATFADGVDPSTFDRYVQTSRATMVPFWGQAAYVNYADPTLTSPGDSYFGSNLARLQSIKAAVDPERVFAQPHFV